jgi:hypothetical protein
MPDDDIYDEFLRTRTSSEYINRGEQPPRIEPEDVLELEAKATRAQMDKEN